MNSPQNSHIPPNASIAGISPKWDLGDIAKEMSQPFDDATLEKMDQSASVWFKRWGLEHDKFSDQRWAIHRANAHVPLEAYRCRILHRFGQIVAKKTLVYLDLKYWINFRKLQLGQAVNPAYVALFDILTEQANAGAIVCPLSFWVFEELLKQRDLATVRPQLG